MPTSSLILNFNYTTTVEEYFNKNSINVISTSRIEVNYIHGKISDNKNKLVFGFGDELDADYLTIEQENNNDFFEYIKSFWYFKTSNYLNLIRFIESDDYQNFCFRSFVWII